MIEPLNDYLADLECRRYSQSRLTHVKRTVELLMLYLKEAHQITDWRGVNESHLRAFAVFARTRHRTPKDELISANSLRQWLSCVRSFFGWMNESGRLVHNPSERLELPQKGEPLPRVLSESEMAQLIETADTSTALGLRDRAVMEVLYATGIRLSEAHKLDLYDVDTVTGLVVVRQGKGGRDRVVPLTQTACTWVTRYITEARPELAQGLGRFKHKRTRRCELRKQKVKGTTPALWLSAEGKRLSKQMLAQRIRDYAKGLELGATVHSFRHSCASHLLRGGASIRHVQQLLGHRSLKTTEIYTHVELGDLKRAMEKAEALSSLAAELAAEAGSEAE